MECIKGKFHTILFRNDDSGYTVRRFRLYEEEDKLMTVTGYLPQLPSDILFRLHGEYKEHPRYGMQFQIQTFERVELDDSDSLVGYLSSHTFPGIGKKMAQVLIDTLGTNILQKIQDDPDCLDSVPKMTAKKKEALIEGIRQRETSDEEVLRFFTLHGVHLKQAMKLQAIYGKDMLGKLKENPYRMVEEVDGIGFQTADKFALSMGFEMDHPYRMQAACVSFVMEYCMSTGNSYITVDELKDVLDKKFKGLDYDFDAVFMTLGMARKLVIEENRVYHISQYDAESYIAGYLAMFPQKQLAVVDKKDVLHHLELVQEEYAISYEEKQREAIEKIFENECMILTGGPGTGKTTVVKAMVNLCKRLYPTSTLALCAPTGRAAKRLSELTSHEASTIHSLLRWDLETNTFGKNQEDPLLVDILIVDEFSMVDQYLFYHLLLAGEHFKKIILIGDENQLPSVSPGCVLKDFMESGYFPYVRLDKIFRQKEGSDIVNLAHQIQQDACNEIPQLQDVRFYNCNKFDVKNYCLHVVQEALDRGYSKTSIQVLAPKYGGVAGVDALNVALQKAINPASEYKRELQVGYRLFREQDKILQLKNQPDDYVFNGDIGILVEIIYPEESETNQPRMIVDFEGVFVEYGPDTFSHITHAYCISVHKAQGSEYPIIIMPIVKEYGMMLQKRLIYTGITRAKKSLVLLGEPEAFMYGIQAQDFYVRKTTLQQRMLEQMRWIDDEED